MSEDEQGFDREAYLFRVRLLRLFFEENQVQFAKRLGIPFKRWNHYERGMTISRETAFKLYTFLRKGYRVRGAGR